MFQESNRFPAVTKARNQIEVTMQDKKRSNKQCKNYFLKLCYGKIRYRKKITQINQSKLTWGNAFWYKVSDVFMNK